ncbi:hypothetical protein SDC9_182251 [bioreactor metagenome]|uniref:Uncharacterized protein n=1 Tax=bioreactor metagenome TaxID=1076179 RepID=A0A645H6V0_9ZZZZ
MGDDLADFPRVVKHMLGFKSETRRPDRVGTDFGIGTQRGKIRYFHLFRHFRGVRGKGGERIYVVGREEIVFKHRKRQYQENQQPRAEGDERYFE